MQDKIWEEIEKECKRQERLKAEGRFKFTPADLEQSDEKGINIILEELGEASTCVQEEAEDCSDRKGHDLKAELIQVAACAVQFVRKINKRNVSKS